MQRKPNPRHCSEATRRVSFIIAQPLIAGTSNYVEEDEDIFVPTSLSEKEQDSM